MISGEGWFVASVVLPPGRTFDVEGNPPQEAIDRDA